MKADPKILGPPLHTVAQFKDTNCPSFINTYMYYTKLLAI